MPKNTARWHRRSAPEDASLLAQFEDYNREWKNADLTPHTATAPSFGDSGSIQPGQSWRHTFNEAGLSMHLHISSGDEGCNCREVIRHDI